MSQCVYLSPKALIVSNQLRQRGPHGRAGLLASTALVLGLALMLPQAGQAQVWEKVQRNFLLMFAGNPPELGQDDNPTAPMELQMAQQIMGHNKKYQEAMARDLDFAEKVKTYVESLQFNVQQQQNKQVGRVGVKQEE